MDTWLLPIWTPRRWIALSVTMRSASVAVKNGMVTVRAVRLPWRGLLMDSKAPIVSSSVLCVALRFKGPKAVITWHAFSASTSSATCAWAVPTVTHSIGQEWVAVLVWWIRMLQCRTNAYRPPNLSSRSFSLLFPIQSWSSLDLHS